MLRAKYSQFQSVGLFLNKNNPTPSALVRGQMWAKWFHSLEIYAQEEIVKSELMFSDYELDKLTGDNIFDFIDHVCSKICLFYRHKFLKEMAFSAEEIKALNVDFDYAYSSEQNKKMNKIIYLDYTSLKYSDSIGIREAALKVRAIILKYRNPYRGNLHVNI